MRELRPHPNLDQLRRQARELLRAAKSGEADAAQQFARLHVPVTLSGAQLALAREHGYPSWPKLKEAAERRAAEPKRFVIRYVRSPEELRDLWSAITTIFGNPAMGKRRVFDDFDANRTTMLVVEHEGRIIGGTVQLRLMAIEPWARGIGLGRRLVQTVEGELVAQGRPSLTAHADPENKGFFLRIGYAERGQSKRHMYKGVPVSPRLLERRLALWRRRAGDLDRGVLVEVDPETGKVPPLPW
jgi:GNAT superfamily N-acetyltransferase